jgi:acetyltransferase-like isoleucine patch superfamily enzyme
MTSTTYRLYPNVQLGEGCEIGDFVIIGVPPKGAAPGELSTIIGPGAVIRSHTVIYAGNVIGAGFQTGHGALLRECNTIGDHVSVGSHSVVEHHVTIEDRARVHSQAFVPEYSTLKTGCWVGPRAVLTNTMYPLSPDVQKTIVGPTIMPGAKIGANSTLLPGVVIGQNALVGAGAVVTKDVPAGAVVVGNPARVLKGIRDLRDKVLGSNPYRDLLGILDGDDVDALRLDPVCAAPARAPRAAAPGAAQGGRA